MDAVSDTLWYGPTLLCAHCGTVMGGATVEYVDEQGEPADPPPLPDLPGFGLVADCPVHGKPSSTTGDDRG
jgi:hypothetical protein